MSIAISNTSLSMPGSIIMWLQCDTCGAVERFTHADGFIGAHASAMTKGWLERQAPQGRLWLCPECSGKHA
jgi:hypothetical protein